MAQGKSLPFHLPQRSIRERIGPNRQKVDLQESKNNQ
jgi:hypothetical protein